MFEFEVRELHLAAYIKANGGALIAFAVNKFRFRSDKSLSEWRMDHSNSCCRRVDLELMELRKFLRGEVAPQS